MRATKRVLRDKEVVGAKCAYFLCAPAWRLDRIYVERIERWGALGFLVVGIRHMEGGLHRPYGLAAFTLN